MEQNYYETRRWHQVSLRWVTNWQYSGGVSPLLLVWRSCQRANVTFRGSEKLTQKDREERPAYFEPAGAKEKCTEREKDRQHARTGFLPFFVSLFLLLSLFLCLSLSLFPSLYSFSVFLFLTLRTTLSLLSFLVFICDVLSYFLSFSSLLPLYSSLPFFLSLFLFSSFCLSFPLSFPFFVFTSAFLSSFPCFFPSEGKLDSDANLASI